MARASCSSGENSHARQGKRGKEEWHEIIDDPEQHQRSDERFFRDGTAFSIAASKTPIRLGVACHPENTGEDISRREGKIIELAWPGSKTYKAARRD